MFVACFGGFCLGCALGWSSPTRQILVTEVNLDVNMIGAALPVGAALGMMLVPFLIDWIGRKRTMLWLVPPFLFAWIMIIVADFLVVLYFVGRLLTGICGGIFSVVAPMYVAEISEKQIRGDTHYFKPTS